jgi:hypothetical protein
MAGSNSWPPKSERDDADWQERPDCMMTQHAEFSYSRSRPLTKGRRILLFIATD